MPDVTADAFEDLVVLSLYRDLTPGRGGGAARAPPMRGVGARAASTSSAARARRAWWPTPRKERARAGAARARRAGGVAGGAGERAALPHPPRAGPLRGAVPGHARHARVAAGAGGRAARCSTSSRTPAPSAWRRAPGARRACSTWTPAAACWSGARRTRASTASRVDRYDYVAGDVFDWLERLAKKGERFDVVVCDPPSFATTRTSRFSAARDYAALAEAAARVVAPGGRLVACCNHAGLERAPLRGPGAPGRRAGGARGAGRCARWAPRRWTSPPRPRRPRPSRCAWWSWPDDEALQAHARVRRHGATWAGRCSPTAPPSRRR